MAQLKIKLTPNGCLIKVFIDGKKVSFSDNEATINLKESKLYSLVWFVAGLPGTRYKIAVTDPAQSRTTIEFTLDDTGKDGGQVWVNV